MTSNLFLRTISSLVLFPLVVIAIWFGHTANEEYGVPLFSLLLAVFGTGLAWEWEKMLSKKTTFVSMWTALAVGISAFIGGSNPTVALWAILVIAGIVYFKSKKVSLSFGVLYICLPLLSLEYIYYPNDGGFSREPVLWLFFIVWATDIGGYIVGKTFKGPKLAPHISPSKTWSGLFGAVLFSVGMAYIFYWFFKDYLENISVSFLLASAGILAVISQIGDLFESYIKRRLGLKDSSNLLPGHGGLFDRVDGLLFASMALAALMYAINQGWIFS